MPKYSAHKNLKSAWRQEDKQDEYAGLQWKMPLYRCIFWLAWDCQISSVFVDCVAQGLSSVHGTDTAPLPHMHINGTAFQPVHGLSKSKDRCLSMLTDSTYSCQSIHRWKIRRLIDASMVIQSQGSLALMTFIENPCIHWFIVDSFDVGV